MSVVMQERRGHDALKRTTRPTTEDSSDNVDEQEEVKRRRMLMSDEERECDWEREYNLRTSARELRENGYTVVPIASSESCVRRLADMVREDMRQYPEFEGDGDGRYVMGAFGGFGNPSSFHGTGVREVRSHVHEVSREIFKLAYADDADKKSLVCEQLLDRVVERHPGTKPGAEGWHRDSTPKHVRVPYGGGDVLVGERINDVCAPFESETTTSGTLYGGWINLSEQGVTQYFVCAPGTHRDRDESGNSGFAPIENVHTRELDAQKREVSVPPGHWLLFQQNLAHKVRSYTVRQRELRVHIAFNVSRGYARPLFGDQYHARVIRQLESPLLPSGQLPPLYSPNHLACFPERLSEWACARLIKDILYDHTFSPSAKRAGQTLTLPHRFVIRLPSVVRALPPYSIRDKAVLTPRYLFSLLT